MYWHCKFDEFSTSHLQRYKAFIFGCLILQRENCYTPTKEIDFLWVQNMICKLSKIWLISQYFQRHTDVEILSSFGWHVFKVLLTLKFWQVFDVMFSTSYWHWNFDEYSTSIFQRPTDVDFWLFNVVNQIQRIFNVGTTSYACWVKTESKNSLSLLNYLGNLECSGVSTNK